MFENSRSGCAALSRLQSGQEREVPGTCFKVRETRSVLEDSEHHLELLAVVVIIVIFLVEHELDARERSVPGFIESVEPVRTIVVVTALRVEHHRVHGVDRKVEVGFGDGVHGFLVLLEWFVPDQHRIDYTPVNTGRFRNVSGFLLFTPALVRSCGAGDR